MKRKAHIVVGALLFLVMGGVQAATVSLAPPVTSITSGGQTILNVDVIADFGSTLVSDGLFSVTWPEFLDAPTFQFEQSLADKADAADSVPGAAGFILTDPLMMGPGTKIGTFAFPANGLTGSGLIEFDPSSAFFDSTGEIPDVELIGTLATVPLPPAVWLLMSALVLLAGASRARKPLPPAMSVATV